MSKGIRARGGLRKRFERMRSVLEASPLVRLERFEIREPLPEKTFRALKKERNLAALDPTVLALYRETDGLEFRWDIEPAYEALVQERIGGFIGNLHGYASIVSWEQAMSDYFEQHYAADETLQQASRNFVLIDHYFDNGPLSKYAALRISGGQLHDRPVLLTDDRWYDELASFSLTDYFDRLEACLGKQEWQFHQRTELEQPEHKSDWKQRVASLVELLSTGQTV